MEISLISCNFVLFSSVYIVQSLGFFADKKQVPQSCLSKLMWQRTATSGYDDLIYFVVFAPPNVTPRTPRGNKNPLVPFFHIVIDTCDFWFFNTLKIYIPVLWLVLLRLYKINLLVVFEGSHICLRDL